MTLPFLLLPLFVELPYRVNIFLSWEGAYRLYLGQLPFRDFGLPMGFGYWLVPFVFFKLFGPTFLSLIKAQVLLNALSVLSLRGILYDLKVKPFIVSLTLVVFLLGFVIFNFWPWYNNSVVVYELATFYFLLRFVTHDRNKWSYLNLFLSSALAFLTLFTKQDVGGMCFILCILLLAYPAIKQHTVRPLIFFTGCYVAVAAIVILPFVPYHFLYWFNYGQPPHSARISLTKIADVFFGEPLWEKGYLVIFTFMIIASGGRLAKQIVSDRSQALLTILCLGMIGQAVVTRVSSPLPTDHMSYFHAFGFVLLVSLVSYVDSPQKVKGILAALIVLAIEFSPGYWKYVKDALHITITANDTRIPRHNTPWVKAPFPGFAHVLMPAETIDGIRRLLKTEQDEKPEPKVLNMSELTPLALDLGYTPPTNQPLWYHLNVGMFQEQVNEFCCKVRHQDYDLALFEDIPNLDNFYPYQVRDTLRKYYTLKDKFLAPRKLENSTIEVYIRKDRDDKSSSDVALH